MSYKFPLATFTWDDAEYGAIQSVVDSNVFSMGPRVAQFEREFAEFSGSRFCVMVNSGSSANLAMIAAMFYTKDESRRLRPGDEVIVPAVSWSTTYYPLHQYGLKVKFVDIDLQTLNMDVEQVRKAVSSHTRAILAVNLLGNPCDFNALQVVCDEHHLVLLEDNCESMGATLEGRQCGTFGLMGSYSTFFSHHISTMEGGLICTDDEELYHILLCLRAHGWTRNLPQENLVTGRKSDDPFEESFKFVLPGYNLRPLEMGGALGSAQVKKLPSIVAERRRNGAQWTERMINHPDLLIQHEHGNSSWFGFSIVIRPGSRVTRPQLLERLRALGFECRPIVTGNFAKNPVVQYFDHEVVGQLENANHIDKLGLFVGNHHYPIPEAIEAIASLRF
ncbi:DegT/DnrJ/EryC1/StrS aminotransferase family protein [Chromobacterium sp. Beijing]|uniref:DegT/DnrJ/EryC1/StrS family aminotransferase n=1 Tax=Chromobacterium sp. Beijing TaxID=2735795 RepID=UPI001F2CD0E4|nr:DegT/DnrJ/EryC1/StrS family aminotransferase [Chromobacterium sp. Beijing]UJB33571.1 DegT/DnrJ/EryC1/StrS family aminotransferase [Chromobacterium sp. Beijing]